MLKAYRKERIEECLSALRGLGTKGWDKVLTWDDVIRNIKTAVDTLEEPDQEIPEPAQDRGENHIVDVNNMIPEPAQDRGKREKNAAVRMKPWVIRKWGMA